MEARIKNKNSAGVKAAIFFGSLLCCVLVLEVGLRVTGFAITASRQREFVPPFEERTYHVDETFERYRPDWKRDRLVLTLGDSLTNGGNVKSYHSYPYQLFKNFEKAGTRTAVYNMGYCEDSTFGVAIKFKNYLNSHKDQTPDAVVILVGAADLFNIPLIRERKLKDDTFWHDVFPRGWFYGLRIYKVYRHIKLNLAVRAGAKFGSEDPRTNKERYLILKSVYDRHKAVMNGDERKPLSGDLVEELEAAFPDDIRQSDLDVEIPGDFTDLLSDYAGRVFTTQHKYDEFFGLLLDFAETFAGDFWNDYFTSVNYHFVQSYQAQSKYTAADILKVLDASVRKHPDLAYNENFRHFRKIINDREEMDEYVDRKRMEAWDEIVSLAQANGIQVVLQNYPVAYKGANRIIERVAKKYDLPLVDNFSTFGALIEKGKRTKYLEDDDHLKPIGNEVLAKRVYEALAKTEAFSSK
jgi:lysophospholipase L1-like esterase